MGAAQGKLYFTTNGGESWKQVATGGQPYQPVNSLAIDSTGGFWAGSDKELFHSTNQGVTWEKLPDITVPQIVAAGPDGRIVIATVENGYYTVRLSSDAGVTWLRTTLDSARPPANLLPRIHTVVIPDSLTVVVASNDGTIFISKDAGVSWQQRGRNMGVPWFAITAFAYTSSGEIFGGTPGRGIYKLAEEDTLEPVTETQLNLPFPNPFQNSILIPSSLRTFHM